MARSKPSAKSVEEQENRMINLAMDLAEQQLREGTASQQVITHFLKLGAQREALETEKIKKEIALLQAKADAIEASKNMENMFNEAIEAMREYGGEDKIV